MTSIDFSSPSQYFNGSTSVELALETTPTGVYVSDCGVSLNPYDRRDSSCKYSSNGYVKPGDTEAPYDYSHLPHTLQLEFLHEEFTYHSLFGLLPPEWLTPGGRGFVSGVQEFGSSTFKLRRSPKAKRGHDTGLYWEWEGSHEVHRLVRRTFNILGTIETIDAYQPVKLVLIEAGEVLRAVNPSSSSCGLSIALSFVFEPFGGITPPAVPARGDIPIGSALDLALEAAGYARGAGGAYQYPTVWSTSTLHRVGDLDGTTSGTVWGGLPVIPRFNYSNIAVDGLSQSERYTFSWPTPNSINVTLGFNEVEPNAKRLQTFVAGHLPSEYGVNEVYPPATRPPVGEDQWTPLPTQPIHLTYLYEDPDPATIQPVFPGSANHVDLWFVPGGPYKHTPEFMPDVTQWIDITRGPSFEKVYPTTTYAAGINIQLTKAD